MGRRSFHESAVIATGVQHFRKRRNDTTDSSQIARWRCNLTGLSQLHNLYFVASNEDIYCHVPHFPTQEIPEHPVLIVTSKPSTTEPTGFMDPYHPHAINNLVVQLLGNEEVVAAVRDDGDVTIFLVRHIIQAIERRCDPENSIGKIAHDVRPLWQSNVGMSAWGLAIHSEARTIAVSANTHNVTVFRFGLVGEGVGKDQAEDVLQRVVNGTANIPHIAFCNTGDDPGARWLLTTDISGYCRTIDLREMVNAQTFRFGRPAIFNTHDRWNSGWGIMFLDRRSFVPEDSVEAALGLEVGRGLPQDQGYGPVWDISSTAMYVRRCNARFPCQSQGSANALTLLHMTPDSDSASTATTTTEQLMSIDETDTNSDGEGLTPDDDLGQLAGLDIEDSTPHYSTAGNLCGELPCPILHASVCNVYLMQPSSTRTIGQMSPFSSPLIGMTGALRQRMTEHHLLNGFERLNMHAYIPSLGIIILASQKGRALVLSLTRFPKTARTQDGLTSQHPRTVYGMRIEHILPFAEQEDAGERPLAPLAGIATGPIQGTERLPLGQRRWRLMMMYHDRTILSYEIRRQRMRDSAVDLASVMA